MFLTTAGNQVSQSVTAISITRQMQNHSLLSCVSSLVTVLALFKLVAVSDCLLYAIFGSQFLSKTFDIFIKKYRRYNLIQNGYRQR